MARVFSRLLWAKMRKAEEGKQRECQLSNVEEGLRQTGARLRLLWTSSSSVDVEVCAASEHISPMSLFQFECDNETPTLQLRSANGCYLAQVRA